MEGNEAVKESIPTKESAPAAAPKAAEYPFGREHCLWDIQKIMEIIPHRYPFLLVDRIIEFVDAEKVVGIKNVTATEPYFQGHFPGRPVMPGVMMIEAMAQTGGILAIKSTGGVLPGKTVFLTTVDAFKFKQMVVPGDTLRIEMRSVKRKRPLWMMEGEITVDGKVVAYGKISAIESD